MGGEAGPRAGFPPFDRGPGRGREGVLTGANQEKIDTALEPIAWGKFDTELGPGGRPK